MQTYRELIVWQKSIDLVEATYQLTALLPLEEKYGLISQIRRAVASIPANIAEGYSRNYRAEYAQFVSIAFASGAELETHLIVAKRLKLASEQSFEKTEELLLEVMKMLNALRQTLHQ